VGEIHKVVCAVALRRDTNMESTVSALVASKSTPEEKK
jgi:hypothetical protein